MSQIPNKSFQILNSDLINFEKCSIFIENKCNAFSNVYYPFFTANRGFELDLQSKITILKLSHETLRSFES